MKLKAFVLALGVLVAGAVCARGVEKPEPDTVEGRCYNQALKLLSPSAVKQWKLQESEYGGAYARFVATRNGERAEIEWSSGTGRDAIQSCGVQKIKNGKVVFERDAWEMASNPKPKFAWFKP